MKTWAKTKNIPLYHIEIIVPFVENDENLHVVFFLDTEVMKEHALSSGLDEKLEAKYKLELKNNKYPYNLAKITFEYDSHENVVQNYEGSYFYRMR